MSDQQFSSIVDIKHMFDVGQRIYYACLYPKYDWFEKTFSIKKIIENELFDQNRFQGTNEYTVQDYDDFLAKAKDVWVRIRQLNKGDTLSIPTFSYWFNTEQRYIDELQKQKQDKIERMARDNKSSQSKKALIPKYKKWKATIPKFQRNFG